MRVILMKSERREREKRKKGKGKDTGRVKHAYIYASRKTVLRVQFERA